MIIYKKASYGNYIKIKSPLNKQCWPHYFGRAKILVVVVEWLEVLSIGKSIGSGVVGSFEYWKKYW
jgi:hypothetical protein